MNTWSNSDLATERQSLRHSQPLGRVALLFLCHRLTILQLDGTQFMRENEMERQPHTTTNYYYHYHYSIICVERASSSLALEVGVKGFHYKQLSRFCHIMANATYAIIGERRWRQTAKKWESLKLILYLRRFIFTNPFSHLRTSTWGFDFFSF